MIRVVNPTWEDLQEALDMHGAEGCDEYFMFKFRRKFEEHGDTKHINEGVINLKVHGFSWNDFGFTRDYHIDFEGLFYTVHILEFGFFSQEEIAQQIPWTAEGGNYGGDPNKW
jgi:hypothetical protein